MTNDANTPQNSQRCFTSDDAFKIGGTTVGSIAIGSALGSILSPAGALVGAVIAGVAGATYSSVEACRHGKAE